MTARLTKKEAKTARLVAASALGGVYSLVILLPKLPFALSFASKSLAAALIILTAFRFYRLKSFFAALLAFLFSSFVFLGIIIGVYLIFKSDLIAVNNSSVYFNIGARGLLLCAFFAYVVSCAVVRIYNRRLLKSEIYTLKIENGGKRVTLLAFADTGNKLREPFSSSPVIVAESEKLRGIMNTEKARLIPASTVNNSTFLKAFKPDKITIKTDKGEEVIENAYVALSEERFEGGFSAVINPEILSV